MIPVKEVSGHEGTDRDVETGLYFAKRVVSVSNSLLRSISLCKRENIRQRPRSPGPGGEPRGNRIVAAAGCAASAALGPLIAWQGTWCQRKEGREAMGSSNSGGDDALVLCG